MRRVCALTIAGLDPGGGAGILADLRAFRAAGVFGCAAAAVLTVQSTRGLVSARALPAKEVVAQAREVCLHQDVQAIKLGALGSAANVRAVGTWLSASALPVVVDTPMLPSRGRGRLLSAGAVAAVRRWLVPRATVLTVNVAEAEALTGRRVTDVIAAERAARELRSAGARCVVVKGGHLAGRDATDVVAVGARVTKLRAPRVDAGPLHGTGCTFASLVAGRLAARGADTDADLVAAVRWAKRVHHRAIRSAAAVGSGACVLLFSRG